MVTGLGLEYSLQTICHVGAKLASSSFQRHFFWVIGSLRVAGLAGVNLLGTFFREFIGSVFGEFIVTLLPGAHVQYTKNPNVASVRVIHMTSSPARRSSPTENVTEYWRSLGGPYQ